MKERKRLKELHDYAWFPDVWRRGMTDFLALFATWFFQYEPVFPVIEKLSREGRFDRLRDFCSGGSGHLASLMRYLAKKNLDVKLELTDKYPNVEAFERLARCSGGKITYLSESVDALDPPDGPPESRLMFSAMHHFSPSEIESIFKKARANRCAVGLFDYCCWDPIRTVPLLILLIPHIFILMPFTRPFSWRKIFWTYVLPAIPLALITDAAISRWNGYRLSELKVIADSVQTPDYECEVGAKPNFLMTGKVVYITGIPKATSSPTKI